MIKRILKDLFLIAMYELGKYLTSLLIIKLESEDDIDTAPADYALNGDQADLNEVIP
ncbi:transcriptional regulator [Staphylococcus epidermidis]|uniref:transcriptional activator RinB n=1 Tax=Staphylococcus epidermidis TaxID=1282 RepID=UPI001C59F163|nr:transcriptional activator RinB [Staphylococcus epidermidis]QXV20046.1 transcriptional regulator [Staphylococcus epidermidis]QXV20102.1 transcriptional regulator [Staphylococcus epidermidis]